MTSQTEALVAAAYRAAAEVCEERAWGIGGPAAKCAEAIHALTPADAEAKLRELVLEAVKAARYGAMFADNVDEDEALVDEVLNGH